MPKTRKKVVLVATTSALAARQRFPLSWALCCSSRARDSTRLFLISPRVVQRPQDRGSQMYVTKLLYADNWKVKDLKTNRTISGKIVATRVTLLSRHEMYSDKKVISPCSGRSLFRWRSSSLFSFWAFYWLSLGHVTSALRTDWIVIYHTAALLTQPTSVISLAC